MWQFQALKASASKHSICFDFFLSLDFRASISDGFLYSGLFEFCVSVLFLKSGLVEFWVSVLLLDSGMVEVVTVGRQFSAGSPFLIFGAGGRGGS